MYWYSEISKGIYQFQYQWLFKQNENQNAFDESKGIWWLVYVENFGMFCFLYPCHDTASPTKGDRTWKSKQCVCNIMQAIKPHSNSAMHKVGINNEHLQRTSPFHQLFLTALLSLMVSWKRTYQQDSQWQRLQKGNYYLRQKQLNLSLIHIWRCRRS